MPALLLALLLAAARTITGQFTIVYAPDDGTQTVAPLPPSSGTTVAAYQWSAKTGSYTIYNGSLDGNGNVSIPGVPAGNYFLAINDPSLGLSFSEMSTSTPDLS